MKQWRYSFIPSSHQVVSSQLNVLAASLSGKVPQYPLNKRMGGWMISRREKSPVPARNLTTIPVIQPADLLLYRLHHPRFQTKLLLVITGSDRHRNISPPELFISQ